MLTREPVHVEDVRPKETPVLPACFLHPPREPPFEKSDSSERCRSTKGRGRKTVCSKVDGVPPQPSDMEDGNRSCKKEASLASLSGGLTANITVDVPHCIE